MENHYEPLSSSERRHRQAVEAGRKGGKAPRKRPRWFAEHPELARKWGSVGGKSSKRRKIYEE